MAIWSAEIRELEKLYGSLQGKLPELEKELGRLVKAEDENMVLLYSRRCLEVIITDLCECELKRPRGTEPLQGIIDKLHKEDKVPSHIIASMQSLNSLSTFGTHPKEFDPEQVKPVLVNLDIIIKWYFKNKKSLTISEINAEVKHQSKGSLVEVNKAESGSEPERPLQSIRHKLLSGILITAVLVSAALIAYQKIFRRDKSDNLKTSEGRISVAVMPFQNMTNDTTWNVWQNGIQNEIITSLTNSEELQVRQIESITGLIQSKGFTNIASITPSVASSISQKLDANVFILGSIKQAGNSIRVNAQLIDSKTEDTFKSFQIDGIADNIFHITDSLSKLVKNFLIMSVLNKDVPDVFKQIGHSNSPEAYRYFIYGNKSFYDRDYSAARSWYLQALAVDSNLVSAAIHLSVAYTNQTLYEEGKYWCMKVYEKRDIMPLNFKIITNWLHALYFETPFEEIKYLRQALDVDDQSPLEYFLLGNIYRGLSQFDKAIPEYEKALEITNKWGIKPMWILNYTNLGFVYHLTGQYKKEKRIYEKAEKDFPENDATYYRRAVLALSEGRIKDADEYIEKYHSLRREREVPESAIANSVASIYEESGILDKAEEFYRQALALEPENPIRLNNLAWFLIDKDRNIDEGLVLIEKALRIRPDVDYMLDTKGWGLYKQEKYKEALDILQKSWDLKSLYNHEIYLHLEAAKKAVAGQRNN